MGTRALDSGEGDPVGQWRRHPQRLRAGARIPPVVVLPRAQAQQDLFQGAQRRQRLAVEVDDERDAPPLAGFARSVRAGRPPAQPRADHRSVADRPVTPVARPISASEAPAATAARTASSRARAAAACRAAACSTSSRACHPAMCRRHSVITRCSSAASRSAHGPVTASRRAAGSASSGGTRVQQVPRQPQVRSAAHPTTAASGRHSLRLVDHLEADLAAGVRVDDPVAAEDRAVGPEALGGAAVAVGQPHPVAVARRVVGSAGHQQTAGAAGAGTLRAVGEQRYHPTFMLLAVHDRAHPSHGSCFR